LENKSSVVGLSGEDNVVYAEESEKTPQKANFGEFEVSTRADRRVIFCDSDLLAYMKENSQDYRKWKEYCYD
jgi:hypothetical protein